jgi:hypothetical protein
MWLFLPHVFNSNLQDIDKTLADIMLPVQADFKASNVMDRPPETRGSAISIVNGTSCGIVFLAVALRLIAKKVILRKFDLGDLYITGSLVRCQVT